MTSAAEKGRSFAGIVRATSILGSASVATIVASVVRTKMAALVLGPAGIGLIGLFQNLLGTASAVAGLGINTVGTRQIAEAAASGEQGELVQASHALFWGTLVLAACGGILFFIVRTPVSVALTGDARHTGTIGWLSLGLIVTVLAGSQTALLTGLRRLRALATIGVITAVLSIAAAAGALWLLPRDWVVIGYLLGTPLIAVLVGQWVLLRNWPARPARIPLQTLRRHWSGMARVGFWFTAAGLVGASLLLAARALLARELGPASLGQFQAAWAISSMYLAVILQAMGSDYYPRLTAIIADPVEVNRTVNAQTQALLLLAAPAIFVTLAGAPILVHLLYSRDFDSAAWVLRWQVLSDIFKLAAWPASFVLLASGSGRSYFVTDTLAPAVLVAFIWLAIPRIGIYASGLAFVAMYGFYLPLVFAIVRRRTRLRWSRQVVILMTTTLTGSGAILAAAAWQEAAALVVGAVVAAAATTHLLFRLIVDDVIAAGPLKAIGQKLRARRG